MLSQEQVYSDVSKYLEISNINEKKNPLKWWTEHAKSYPSLVTLARQYLAVQGRSGSPTIAFRRGELMTVVYRTTFNCEKQASQLLFLNLNEKWVTKNKNCYHFYDIYLPFY